MCSNHDSWDPISITIKRTWSFLTSAMSFFKHESAEFIESSSFCNDTYKDIKWRLLLYPNGLNEAVRDFISLFVICDSDNIGTAQPPDIKFTIKVNHGADNLSSCGQLCVSRDNESACCWGFPQFLRRTDMIELLKNSLVSSIDVICIIHFFGYIFPRTYSLHDDIGTMFDSPKFSDVKLKVKGEIFYGHKIILASRSPKFAVMFDEHTPLNKSDGDFVTIQDIDLKVFKDMLRYMYTGQLPNFKETVLGLLPAADQYDLDELMTACAIYLYNNLTTENVSDVLILADFYDLAKLKAKAIEFINTHGKIVIATNGFNLLYVYHQHLIFECYQALILAGDDQC